MFKPFWRPFLPWDAGKPNYLIVRPWPGVEYSVGNAGKPRLFGTPYLSYNDINIVVPYCDRWIAIEFSDVEFKCERNIIRQASGFRRYGHLPYGARQKPQNWPKEPTWCEQYSKNGARRHLLLHRCRIADEQIKRQWLRLMWRHNTTEQFHNFYMKNKKIMSDILKNEQRCEPLRNSRLSFIPATLRGLRILMIRILIKKYRDW